MTNIRAISLLFVFLIAYAASVTALGQQAMPIELGNQRTNVASSSNSDPERLAKLVDRSKCGAASDNIDTLGLASGLSTRGGTGSTFVKGGLVAGGGIWRAMYWDRKPDAPLCGFRSDPKSNGSSLTIYGVRHSREVEAVNAIENGKFFCKCKSLAR